jgi:hypothetical protein
MKLPSPPLPRGVRVLFVAVFITGWILSAGSFIWHAIFDPKHICVSIFGSPCPHNPGSIGRWR